MIQEVKAASETVLKCASSSSNPNFWLLNIALPFFIGVLSSLGASFIWYWLLAKKLKTDFSKIASNIFDIDRRVTELRNIYNALIKICQDLKLTKADIMENSGKLQVDRAKDNVDSRIDALHAEATNVTVMEHSLSDSINTLKKYIDTLG